jgi:hypothetical protein
MCFFRNREKFGSAPDFPVSLGEGDHNGSVKLFFMGITMINQ